MGGGLVDRQVCLLCIGKVYKQMTVKALTQKSYLPSIGDKVIIKDGVWRGRFGFIKSVGKSGRYQVRSQASRVTDVFWLWPEQIERVDA